MTIRSSVMAHLLPWLYEAWRPWPLTTKCYRTWLNCLRHLVHKSQEMHRQTFIFHFWVMSPNVTHTDIDTRWHRNLHLLPFNRASFVLLAFSEAIFSQVLTSYSHRWSISCLRAMCLVIDYWPVGLQISLLAAHDMSNLHVSFELSRPFRYRLRGKHRTDGRSYRYRPTSRCDA